jgi:phenylalanyl-tRNA synthetase alpha chain
MAHEAIVITFPGGLATVAAPSADRVITRSPKFPGTRFSVAEGLRSSWILLFEMCGSRPIIRPRCPDTFYITDQILLRSQTSPVQIPVMENSRRDQDRLSGKVFRSDTRRRPTRRYSTRSKAWWSTKA